MNNFSYFFLSLLLFCSLPTKATTWDEPWQETIIKEAEHFVLAVVTEADEAKGIEVNILDDFSGKLQQKQIKINGFYLLRFCSRSAGHGPEFNFDKLDTCYFFLKETADGDFAISTPTSGYAYYSTGKVMATYRHSYHQALVDQEIYENSMQAIFNHYHEIAYDTVWVKDYISTNLSQAPTEAMFLFFSQHVALEMIYHLKLRYELAFIEPFVNFESFHANVSGLRALYANPAPIVKEKFIAFIKDEKRDPFAKVIAVWGLGKIGLDSCSKKELKTLSQIAKKEKKDYDSGFGGNIMDPRVCTHFPDLKSALNKLLGIE